MLRNYLSKRLRVLNLVQSVYTNWLEITVGYVLQRPIRNLVLRQGQIMRDKKSFRITQVISIARLLASGWTVEEVIDDSVIVRGPNSVAMRLRLNIGADFESLCEVFIDKPYGSNFQDFVIIDAGVYTGDPAIFFAKNGAKKVIGLEPDPQNYRLATENILRSGVGDKIVLLNVALSSRSGYRQIHLSSINPHMNSLEPPITFQNQGIYDSVICVQSTTIEELMNRYDVSVVDLLKLDCKGAEYEILHKRDDLELLVVGRGHKPYNKFWIKRIKSLFDTENNNRIKVFIKALNFEERLSLYNVSDIMLLPYAKLVAIDPPLTMLEAMACGKVVITTSVGSPPYIIENGINGLILEKISTEGLMKAI